MERWSGRVALVTGASSGIGAEIAKALVLQGMQVIAVARTPEKTETLQAELQGASGKLYPFVGDVSKEEDILAVFEWANKTLGGVDVLINNAGARSNAKLSESKTENWKSVIDTNVIGLSICTREAIKSMRARGVDDGHIIHIGSDLGYTVVDVPGVAMYSASKCALRALTEALRQELIALNSRIKVTNLNPSLTKTEFGAESNPSFYEKHPHLVPKDLAAGLLFVLGTPENVQVTELIMKPVQSRF